LYAEPIYLQAERSPMPELRLVVLALQDKLAYGPTFEAAMAALFGGALIAEAAHDLADYERLTAEGKLGEAGQKLEELKRVLDKLNARRK
jgi:uncharacterized membrane protein (UPF0182 family)